MSKKTIKINKYTDLLNLPTHIDANLKIINLSFNDFSSLPKSINGDLYCLNCDIKSLKHFPEINNNIHIISSNLPSMKYIQPVINGSLILTKNKISKIEDIKEVYDLNISYNYLTSTQNLPITKGDISLHNNQISELIDFKINSKNPIDLNLSNNNIKSFPPEFKSLTLKGFTIKNNNLTSLKNGPKSAFIFDASYNNLTSFDLNTEIDCKLDISHNYLTELSLDETHKENFGFFASLIANNNKIKKIDLRNVLRMEMLNLDNNYLTNLNNLPQNLEILHISNNPITSYSGLSEINIETNIVIHNNNLSNKNILELLLIKNIKDLRISTNKETKQKINEVMNKYEFVLSLHPNNRKEILKDVL